MNPITLDFKIVNVPRALADDRELAARLARGDPQAFDQLVEHYGHRVTALAARLLDWSEGTEDVTQDVFLAVLRKGKSFRGEAQLWTYLAAITVNRCRSVRRRRWLQERALRMIAPFRHEQTTTVRSHERIETAAAVRAAIAGLPANSREVIVLRYLEELSVDEVAEVLGLRHNTVEVRLSRARKLLEQSLACLAHETES